MIAITNGTILTITQGTIAQGTVLVEGGRIVAVGEWIEIPDDAEIYDAEGKTVMPGMIDAHCHVSLFPEGIGWQQADGNETTDPITPHLRALDALNRLRTAGHEIVVLTSRPEWATADTFLWVGQHELPTREIHMLWEKWLVPCDAYLDDAPRLLAGYRAERPQALACRFVRPWNEPIPGVHDVVEWPGFEALVAQVAG